MVEQSTPAELASASVLINRRADRNSTLAQRRHSELPPSPMTAPGALFPHRIVGAIATSDSDSKLV